MREGRIGIHRISDTRWNDRKAQRVKDQFSRGRESVLTEDFVIRRLNAITSAIEHEDDLIGQRTTWLVMGQSFLFAAFASLLQQGDVTVITRGVKLMRLLIPLVGLLMPVLVLLAVSAATYEIWRWRTEHDRLCRVLEEKGLEWLPVGPTSWVVVTGQVLPIAVSLGFAVAWAVILTRLRAT